MSLMDKSWEKIFERGQFLEKIERDGFFLISPDQLKELSDKREPRLLAKIDSLKSSPEIFKKNKLSILSVQNDLYMVFKDADFKTFYPVKQLYDTVDTEEYCPELDFRKFESLSINEISSESQAIDFAYIISLIRTFTGEKELYLTIRGRHGSKKFSFNIPASKQPVNVSGVQIEVDAGFESPSKIYLFEAKMGRVDDFNIRQLFYPYKDWLSKSTKEIIPIFFIYTNGLFYFFQFTFCDQYGKLDLVKSKCYTINEGKIQRQNLTELLDSTPLESEPDVPFPQANDLDKVIDLIMNTQMGITNRGAIAELFDFEDRQGDYYANAAVYLGLLKRTANFSEFLLTNEGKSILNSEKRNQRNIILLQQILKKPTFNEIIRTAYDNSRIIENINTDLVVNIIQKHVNINDTTARRRSSTVLRWIKWINDNIEFV